MRDKDKTIIAFITMKTQTILLYVMNFGQIPETVFDLWSSV